METDKREAKKSRGEPTVQDWGDVIATLIIGVLGVYCVVAAVVGSEHPMLIRLVTATVGFTAGGVARLLQLRLQGDHDHDAS